MGTEQRRILVVAPSLPLANSLLRWLTEAGYEVAVVTSFSAAKAHLRTSPDVLLTEVRLRDYNGLHLALRAREDGIPAIVIGSADPVLEQDAQTVGAAYVLTEGLVREDVLHLIDQVLPSPVSRHGEGSVAARVGQVIWRDAPPAWHSTQAGNAPRRPTLH